MAKLHFPALGGELTGFTQEPADFYVSRLKAISDVSLVSDSSSLMVTS